MKTWSQKIKDERIEFAKKLHDSGMFVQNQWLNRYAQTEIPGVFCGCMHGAITQSNDDTVLDKSAKHLQWPLWLCHLTVPVFDGLPEGEHSAFVIEVMHAVPTSADITRALHDINIARMMRLKDRFPGQGDIFDQVADVWRDDVIDITKAKAAAAAATEVLAESLAEWSAARAAKAAAESLAEWSAAKAAREAAESLAAKAAREAREAVAAEVERGEAAREAAWRKEAETLIESLKKIPDGK